MYLFGGSHTLDSNKTFYALNLQKMQWEVVRSRGANNDSSNIPEAADEHTAVVSDDNMILFGGFVMGERTNDVHLFNFTAGEWKRIECGGEQPCARAGHSALIHHDGTTEWMYVFGGKDAENDKLNDLWRLNLTTFQWEEVSGITGYLPQPRSGHSAVAYKGFMLVFGGIFEITKELNDTHLYDFKNNRWLALFEETGVLSPRHTHTPSTQSPLKNKKTSKAPTATGGETPDASLQGTKTMTQTKKKETTSKPKPPRSPKQKVEEEPVNLESPTSVTLKASFLLKQDGA